MKAKIIIILLAFGLTNQTLAQELLRIGDLVPVLNLKDQYDIPHQISAENHKLILAIDNESTALAVELIESREQGWLSEGKQVFLADIHKMPSIIARIVAIPQLRKKHYPILLGNDMHELQIFPRKKNCVTVVKAKEGKVSNLVFACTRDELLSTID